MTAQVQGIPTMGAPAPGQLQAALPATMALVIADRQKAGMTATAAGLVRAVQAAKVQVTVMEPEERKMASRTRDQVCPAQMGVTGMGANRVALAPVRPIHHSPFRPTRDRAPRGLAQGPAEGQTNLQESPRLNHRTVGAPLAAPEAPANNRVNFAHLLRLNGGWAPA